MKQFKLSLITDDKRDIFCELNEMDIVVMIKQTYFSRRNIALGNTLLDLLAYVNGITKDKLIEKFNQLYGSERNVKSKTY